VRWTAFRLALLVVAVLAALSVGRYPLRMKDIADFLLAATGLKQMPKGAYDLLYNVIVQIRLPRVLTAVLVGAALATSGGASIIMLVLGGVISGTLFTALLSIAKFAADPGNKLPAIEYWLMGNLSLADTKVIGWAVAISTQLP